MPGGSVGIGSTFFGGRGRLTGGRPNARQLHFDGMECFNIFLPIFPSRAVHVWEWKKDNSEWSFTKRDTTYSYRAMPIRWTNELVIRVLLIWWLWIPINLGGLLIVGPAFGLIAKALGLLLMGASISGYVYIRRLDQRDKRIRQLLGKHRLGYSDPVYWTDELQRFAGKPDDWFGCNSFLSAAEQFLQQQLFSEAMWAARLCAAFENQNLGETMTSRIIDAAPKDLVSPPNLNLPKLSFPKTEGGRFWQSIYSGDSQVKFTETMFANNIFGSLAAAFDSERPEDAEQLEQYHRLLRDEPDAAAFKLRSIGLITAIVMLCGFTALVANQFKTKTPAQRAFEEAEQWHRERRKEMEKGYQAAKERFRKTVEEQTRNMAERYNPKVKVSSEPQAAPPAAKSGDWMFLVELEFLEAKQGPWKITRDGSTGERFKQVPITVDGAKSPHGIGMHPPRNGHASVKFSLQKQADQFSGIAALNDTATAVREHALFEIWGDDQKLWESEKMTQAGQKSPFEVDVSDVDVLELRVISPGDYWSLHAVWFEPRIRIK